MRRCVNPITLCCSIRFVREAHRRRNSCGSDASPSCADPPSGVVPHRLELLDLLVGDADLGELALEQGPESRRRLAGVLVVRAGVGDVAGVVLCGWSIIVAVMAAAAMAVVAVTTGCLAAIALVSGPLATSTLTAATA